MQITIDAGEGAVEIAGEGRDGVMGFTLSGERSVQIRQFLRGDYGVPEDRGNQLFTLSFSVSRQHDTLAAAQLYTLRLAAIIPAQGLVKFNMMEGELVFKRYFNPGVVRLNSVVPNGVRTVATYTILGGKLLREDEL